MEQLLQDLLDILSKQGWVIALIALLSIILLGVLKYCNVFKKLDETYRHILYLLISVGASIIGTVIDLACIHKLNIETVLSISAVMFMLNQTAYAVYAATPLKELVQKLLDAIKKLIDSKVSSMKAKSAAKKAAKLASIQGIEITSLGSEAKVAVEPVDKDKKE